jgi:N-acetyl-anhydromuramyl-L-alanine amidase AmpD
MRVKHFSPYRLETYQQELESNQEESPRCIVGIIIFALIATVICMGFLPKKAHGETIDTTKAVIHHSATKDVSINVIKKYHIQHNGWKDVGYHFLIRTDGTIEKGRPLTMRGAHAPGRNNYIGICLTGKGTFTKAQIKSLITLLNDLGVKHIERHHNKCPGRGLDMGYVAKHITPIAPLTGKASLYTDTKTANGEKFRNNLSCATKTANYGMKFKVTNLETGKSVVVRNNDFGPHKQGRIIDLTPAAFSRIAPISRGIIPVRIEVVR